MASAFDGDCQSALVFCAEAGLPTGANTAVFIHIPPQRIPIFVIKLDTLLDAASRSSSAASIISIVSHNILLNSLGARCQPNCGTFCEHNIARGMRVVARPSELVYQNGNTSVREAHVTA